MKKFLLVWIVVLLIIISIVPSSGNIILFDDNTPPVTTCVLDPPEPDGLNGWYVSNVIVTLNATDDISGVNTTYYRVDEGEWEIYTEPFLLSEDGIHSIEYYSVDNAGNVEEVKSSAIYIDQTKPEVHVRWDVSYESRYDFFEWWFTVNAEDETSGMNRVEFYQNDVLQNTIIGPGPSYQWLKKPPIKNYNLTGYICKREITEDNISFFALIVRYELNCASNYLEGTVIVYAYDNAGNSGEDWTYYSILHKNSIFRYKPLIFFTHFTMENNYDGYIGKFIIKADFEKGPLY